MSGNRLGRALSAARAKAGLGLRELAREIDTDPSYICHLEKGRRIPTLHTLVRLADELGADAFALAKAAIQDLRARPAAGAGVTSGGQDPATDRGNPANQG